MNFELLKRLCETPGVPSREERVRALVVEELRALVDEVTVDAMGNVVGHKRGAGGPRVMIAAHMDEIGFLVRYIDDEGFIRLHPVGGWDVRSMLTQRVHVHGFAGETLIGALMPDGKPTFLLSGDEKDKLPRKESFYVDVGLPADEVKQRVELGDPVTMARETVRAGNLVMSKALDDRLGVFVMLEALRALGEHRCDIFAVATTQEEVGTRGAITSAYALEPDVGIALDVTLAMDQPDTKEPEHVTRLGEGPALKLMDNEQLSHPRLVRHLRDVAEQHNIPYQLELLPLGGTDAGAIQRTRAGTPTITLSIPTRYVHSVNESAAVADIEASITLLARYLEVAHEREYGYDGESA